MSEWHGEARTMRANGVRLKEIAGRFGVSMSMASRVCEGVRCPVNHRAIAGEANLAKARADGKTPRGRKPTRQIEHGQFIRQNYRKISAARIANILGISRNSVIGVAYRMGLSHPAPQEQE